MDHWRISPQSSCSFDHLIFSSYLNLWFWASKEIICNFTQHWYQLLTHCQCGKVSEMNWDKLVSHQPTVQSKEKWQSAPYCRKNQRQMMMIEPRRNSRHFGRFLRQFRLHWFWHSPPPACETQQLKEKWYDGRVSLFCFFLWPLTNLIHCFSVFSSILVAALSYPSPPIATSSKNSISFRKWKLHHLRCVSIKLEGRRNGNVKIENLGWEIQNAREKN